MRSSKGVSGNGVLALVGAVFVAGTMASGCMVVEKRRPAYVAAPVARPACHPSQYWDGSQCRHKGKGHGARKHDGRRK
jgi:hypothetical protein